MSMHKPRPMEIISLQKLSPQDRYNYFIKKFADFEEACVLSNSANIFASSEWNEHLVFPIWSSNEFAKLCAVEDWEGLVPRVLLLDEFLTSWLISFAEDGTLIEVFPASGSRGFIVTPQEFYRDVCVELLTKDVKYPAWPL